MPAVQLAVGEGACAAFAELHVGFGVELAFAPQAPGVLGAFAHFLAALQDDRAEAHLRQQQPGEDAAGAGADDDRALAQSLRRLCHDVVAHVRCDGDMRDVFLQQRRFVLYLHVHGIGQHDGVAFARIVTAPEDGEAEQVGSADAQPLEYRGLEIVCGMVEREADFGKT